MKESESHLKTLNEIRDIMNKSSRFISLSGLSGISAGVIAMIGVSAAYWAEKQNFAYVESQFLLFHTNNSLLNSNFFVFCIIDALLILFFALSFAVFFTIRKSKKTGQSVWDKTAQKLIISLLIPLFTGGLFCIAMIFHQVYFLIVPATLVFYGLSLLNSSKYTLHSVEALAYGEIILGIISAFYPQLNWICWAVGFGLFHIIYGIFMYYKYEK